MNALWQPLVWLLAGALNRALAQQVEYLKAENAVLRGRLPRRIAVTPQERQTLLRFGRPLGAAIKGLISIVSPRTFARWLRQEKQAAEAKAAGPAPARATPGRPRTPEELRELVVKLARENAWGVTRIFGELKKLGITSVSRSTVRNILREANLEPGPQRGEGGWYEFIQRHLSTLWACDFLSVKTWTICGVVEVYVLFFIHVGSRRVFVFGMTPHPDGPWVVQQARNASMVFGEQSEAPRYLIRDCDSKFVAGFDAVLEADGVEVVKVGPRAPNLNAFAERFVLSIKSECLSRFVFFGERHLRHVVGEYLAHYNAERPHQGIDNVPIGAQAPPEPVAVLGPGDVVCEERLGGLLKHYRRAA